MMGHIDNLAYEQRNLMTRGFRPGLILVTTSNVPYSSSIKRYANKMQIGYMHIIPMFRYHSGALQLNFLTEQKEKR